MAIVFISPRQRQKIFFQGITIFFILIVGMIALIVFLSKPREVPQPLVFTKPKVKIEMDIIGSEEFKYLKAFVGIQPQFHYVGYDEKGKKLQGLLNAESEEEAREKLKMMGISSIEELKEILPGRENPFSPYFKNFLPPETEEKVLKQEEKK